MKHTKTWKSSTQPRKQRKYRRTAPLHVKGKFMRAHLSKALMKKYGTRSMRVRVGDKVKVLRGDFRGKDGKVERVNVGEEKLYITGIELSKKDGTKVLRPIKPCNVLIEELTTDDKRRLKKWSKTTSKD